MAIAQNNFTLYRGKAYEGQISTTDVVEVVSRVVESALVPFGRAVIRGTAARSCAPVTAATTAEDIIGFSVRSLAEFSNSSPTNPDAYATGYPVSHVASILHRGPMFALCVDGANAGDAVIVITADGDNLGRLSAGSAAGVTLNFVRWVDDVVAGEVGEIRVDGVLATPAAPSAGN
ncbi:hypothetical protein [Kosakonia sp. MUSA4]|uniref:structural cement protein Gp24 n=1 Tax=Kosakonia sp. MUSA4 TaxID=2067958 RepID=UPI0015987DBE|nr:hypothetical protein [Kosakonia sp. MUSA4]QJT80428.1 hypothetical protein C0557_10230 [Kosakonia sp. MUSA4]